jgi:hypothetical protein
MTSLDYLDDKVYALISEIVDYRDALVADGDDLAVLRLSDLAVALGGWEGAFGGLRFATVNLAAEVAP